MSLKHRISAYVDLFRRYREIFSYHWQHRDQMGNKLLNEDEAEFLPSALSLQEKPVSPVSRLVAKILMALIACLIIWSVLGRTDIVVNATGKIIPSVRTKTIASVDVASVKALHVDEGQAVRAGDVLIELDAKAFDTERDKAAGDAALANMQVARSRALIEAVDNQIAPRLAKLSDVSEDAWRGEQRHLDAQYRDFRAKLTRIDEEIARYEQMLPLTIQRAIDYKELAQNHDVSTHAYLEKEQARIDLERQLADVRNQRRSLLTETKRLAYDLLTDGSKISASSHQDALRADSHSRLLKLTSPIDGTVQQLSVHTVGGVVPAAQPLMLIVPRESVVEVEAFLENKDIGFIYEGQVVEVKIDAFEYTKFGTISGRVTHVSRDAIQDDKKGLIYSVKVTLDKSTLRVEGKEVALSAGMSVEAEIKTGTRRLIEYVLSPLIQHQREALHER